MTNNYEYCIFDSDCRVGFNPCSCSNFCSNKLTEPAMAQCIRVCPPEEISRNKIEFCQCSKNKCVQGFLKD